MKDAITLLAQYLHCILLGLLLVPSLVSGVALAQTAESDLFHQLTARCDTGSVEIKTYILFRIISSPCSQVSSGR